MAAVVVKLCTNIHGSALEVTYDDGTNLATQIAVINPNAVGVPFTGFWQLSSVPANAVVNPGGLSAIATFATPLAVTFPTNHLGGVGVAFAGLGNWGCSF